MRKGIIQRIDEPDFGCEGLPSGQKRMDQVTIQWEDGTIQTVEIEEERLWENKWDEGMELTEEAL